MDRRYLQVAAVALLALAAGCDRPKTQGTASPNAPPGAAVAESQPASPPKTSTQ